MSSNARTPKPSSSLPAPRIAGALLVFAWTQILAACAPELPNPSKKIAGKRSGLAGVAGIAAVVSEPPAPLESAPSVLRLRITGASVDPSGVALVSGAVGSGQLLEIAKGEVSSALAARVVPAEIWEEAATGDVIVAPTVRLALGGAYALAIGTTRQVVALQVNEVDAWPLLPRVWPPPGKAASADVGVWCGDAPLPDVAVAVALEPGGLRGWIRRGVAAGDDGGRCLHFEADPGHAQIADLAAALLPPPTIAIGALTIALDPRPFTADVAPAPAIALGCGSRELPLGPGCGEVLDDRILGRAPGAPMLWALRGEGLDLVFATNGLDPFAIGKLPPASPIALAVSTVDAAGLVTRDPFRASTLAPRPHVILNEALAHPRGHEPQEEWIEIANDGSAPAELGDYTLVTPGGLTTLPSFSLLPGVIALIVTEGFVGDDGLDVPPAPGTPLLRVPGLGGSGLPDSGAPLSLKDASGLVVSSMPANPRPKKGESVARRRALDPDESPAAFSLGAPTPGRPNDAEPR